MTSPGVAVLVMKEDPSESAKAILKSVISAWPVLLLTVVIAWLAGIVMWALVRHKNQIFKCKFSFTNTIMCVT